jgi:hypothetical protein
MLAEKFFLRLETIIRNTADIPNSESTSYPDGAPKVTCGRHVPIKLPEKPSRRVGESQIVK